MKNLKIAIKVKSTLALKGFLMLFLVLGRFSAVTAQQNNFVITPSMLYTVAGAGMSEINLGFSQGPIPWIAIAQGGFLQVQPQNGSGAETLRVSCQPNDGPARIGYIYFQSPNPNVPAKMFEVYQNQGLDPSMLQFQWNQLIISEVDPQTIPNTGSASFHYFPWERAVFLNIHGRTSLAGTPAWLVRNVHLPDASWMTGSQNLQLPVDLGLLGYGIGQTAGSIRYSWTVSYEPDTVLSRYPDEAWMVSPVIPDTTSASGRTGIQPYSPVPLPDFYHNLIRPFDIRDQKYIGCEMTNGDLDDGTRPGEKDGCAPAAAANSLTWLDSTNGGIGVPKNWRDAFNQLSSLMRTPGKGTADPSFIRAKLDFIEMYDLPIKVKYQDDGMEGDIKSSSGNSSAKCHDAKAGDMPTRAWMVSEAADDEDVEIGMTFPSGKGHWVVLTGTVTIGGKTYINYKDDKAQKKKGGNTQGFTPIDETPGGMVLPGISNGKVDIVVSESFDPDYVAVSGEIPFGKYCQSSKRTLPPGASLTFKYPDNPKRCYNTSIRVMNHGDKKGFQLREVWNNNSGEEHIYVNKTGEPVTIEIHNDDNYDGGGAGLKSYVPYSLTVHKNLDAGGAVTDPGNEEEYAGFSIGSDDDSPEEFGTSAEQQVDYPFGFGSYFADFPREMNSAGCKKLNIRYSIKKLNRYWNDLGLVLGVYSVATPGEIYISSPATGKYDTLSITGPGDYRIDLGGVSATDIFDLTLEIDGNLDFIFDNLGVPSQVQVEPIMEVEPTLLVLKADTAGQSKFRIKNTGGTDLVWTLTKKASWYTLSPMSGNNESEVTIDYPFNTGGSRKDTILVDAPYARNSRAFVIVFQDSASSGINLNKVTDPSISVIPNPAGDKVDFRLSHLPVGELNCCLTDIMGRKVWSQQLFVRNPEILLPVDLSGLPDGIFFVRIEYSKGTLVRKIIHRK